MTLDSPISSRPIRWTRATLRTPGQRARTAATISRIFATAMGAWVSYSRYLTRRPRDSGRRTGRRPSWPGLELVRRTAPAGRLHVGVPDCETRPQHVVVHVVDFTALQVRGALAVHQDLDATRLRDIVVGVGRIVPAELVGHAGAA